MSLLRPIIRSCAVAALRDRTWAGANVFDSDLQSMAEAIQGKADKPYIVVYTDTDDRTPASMAEMYSGIGRKMQLAIEMGVASAVALPNTEEISVRFSATDEGLEWACDVMDGQIMAALWGDPDSVWGELLKRFAPRVLRVPSRRGGQGSGVKFAARRTVYELQTIYEIAPGVVPPDVHPVHDFIRLGKSSLAPVNVADRARTVEKLIVESDPHSAWLIAAAYIGGSRQSIKNIQPDGVPPPWGEPGVELNVEQPPLEEMGMHERIYDLEKLDLVDDNPFELPAPYDVTVGRPQFSVPKVTRIP